ncbi:MAG: hypothetical protein ABJM11_07465 [Marinobacter sp.]|uniref:hypothetical protein n=1 Tax=Marinobacter sp. TaxID=50741 RepID=UPI003296DA2C
MKSSPVHPVHLFLGLAIWAAWFVVLYGGLSVGCTIAPPDSEEQAGTWINGAIVVVASLVGGYLLWCAYRCAQASSQAKLQRDNRLGVFISKTAAAVYLVSSIASLALGVPGVLLPPCV